MNQTELRPYTYLLSGWPVLFLSDYVQDNYLKEELNSDGLVRRRLDLYQDLLSRSTLCHRLIGQYPNVVHRFLPAWLRS